MAASFPKTLLEFTERFSSKAACVEYLREVRWPDGFVCPACGRGGWATSRENFFCTGCRRQTSVTAGTILHKTHLPLRSWFLAMWLVCTQKTGLSAKTLQRELGLRHYRPAWLMLQKLRQAMVRIGRERLRGLVEADETYIGGQEEGVTGRELAGKALVAIAVELDGRRLGRIRLSHITDASADTLGLFMAEAVEPGATVHTDGWHGYDRLSAQGYLHRVTHTRGDHQVAAEVFRHVHLVASLLKRWLGATHQGKVEEKHLQRYLDEFTFRFNRRRSKHVGQLFHRLAEQLVLRQP
jgi:transposase-like protein